MMKLSAAVGLALLGLVGGALLLIWREAPAGASQANRPPLPEPTTVDEVLARWAATFDSIRTLRGSQQIAEMHGHGSPQSPAVDPRGALRATDEVYERQGDNLRYRVAAYFTKCYELTLWDGMHAFR